MSFDRLIRTTAALGILATWAIAVYRFGPDVPAHITAVAVVASGFLFGLDVAALIRAWRHREDDER